MNEPEQRRGARRRADIPEGILAALHAGELATANLVEWLAVDMRVLLGKVIPTVGLGRAASQLLAGATLLEGGPITRFMEGVGALLYEAAARHAFPNEVFAALAAHPSDIVRGWAAFMVSAAKAQSLATRLALWRPFALDRHPLVREHAWYAARPAIVEDLTASLPHLETWVTEVDPRARRFAVEVTRPRGVWCAHCETLKHSPEQAFGILAPLSTDPSRYVQISVGNWLNDASKTRPDWVKDVCRLWSASHPGNPSTQRIVARAARTLPITQADDAAPVARRRRQPLR